MSGLSPGQAAMAAQGSLMDLVEHIFLLPDAGQHDDEAYNTPEFRTDMVKGLHRSLETFESLITGPASVAISRCKRMIGRLLQAKPGAGHLHAQTVQDLLSELPQHDMIALDICAQNAAVLITKTQEGFVIEPFELLAPNATVMGCPGSLVRQFPVSATILPGHVAADTNFVAAFTDLLAQFDVHALEDVAAKAKKGGDEHVEERDTTNPALVTDMLRSWLHGCGSHTASHVQIQKRSREHVRYEARNRISWHRSPLWLFLRVVMRLALDRDDHLENTEIPTFKSFMIFHMASILDQTLSAGYSSEHLHGISAKISRRVHKLALQDEPIWLFIVNASISKVTACLQTRWKQEQARYSPLLDLSSLKTVDFEASTHFHVTELKEHVDWVKTREAMPIAAYDAAQRHDLPRHSSDSLPVIHSFNSDNIWQLFEFEAWVAKHLSPWVDKQCREQNNLADLVARVGSLIEGYHSAACIVYSKNPENLSRAYLVVLELWVACDKLATTSFPLIKEYHPGIPSNAFNKLLLPKLEEMARLRTVELHLKQRSSQARYDTSPFSGVFGQPDSFACQVFNASPSMQGLLDKVRKFQEDGRLQKKEELQRLKSEYNTLISDASRLSHDQYRYQRGHYWTWECYGDCTKCRKTNSAERMQIDIWEDVLPSDTEKCKSIIAELAMDSAVQAWRNASLLLVQDIFVETTPTPDNPQVYWLLTSHRLPLGHEILSSLKDRLQLGSATKPFAVAHYRSTMVSVATPDSVCKPHGSQYLYLDYRLGIAVSPTMASPKIPPACSLAVLSSFPCLKDVRLSAFIRGTSHTSNEVLASQHGCPEDMSLEEFRAFGLLRSDLRLQWPNILIELTSPSLNMRSPETSLLLTQAAYEVGPRCKVTGHGSETTTNATLRVTHSLLDDERFAVTMVHGLGETLKAASETWESSNTCFTLLCLAQRILTGSSSEHIRNKCLGFLAELRSTAFRWANMLFEKVETSESGSERRNLGTTALVFALICHDTFDVELDILSTTFRDCDMAKLLLITSVLAEQYKDLVSGTENVLMKILRQRQQRLAHALSEFLMEAIIDHKNRCLDTAILRFWPAFASGQPWSRAFPASDSCHVLQTMSAASSDKQAVAVSFNFLTGLILVNGLPISVLPADYQSHRDFSILFGEYVPRVVTSNLTGMHFSGSRTHHGWDTHFALYSQSLTIRVLRGSRRYEFIPTDKLGKEVPSEFKHNFFHWLDLDTNTIEFRPLASCWEPDASNWTLHLDMGKLVSREQYLLSATSQVANSISTSLQAIEDPSYMSFVLSGGTVTATLPRLQLSFSLDATSDQLFSDNYAGFSLDPNQSLGTLIGLTNRLILQSVGSERRLDKRMVLVPRGKVEATMTRAGMVVNVSNTTLPPIRSKAVPLKQGSIKYAKFTVDNHLRKLRDNGLLFDRLLLVYLHAVTSGCLPDPLTERTGTEEALRLLNSAAIRSHPEINTESAQLLHKIAGLSPHRRYHPEHMMSMEMISWKARLPVLSQHDAFGVCVTRIEDHAAFNGLLGYQSSDRLQRKESDAALVLRALKRNSFLRTSGFGAEEAKGARDTPYLGRSAGTGTPCQRAACITRIIANGEAKVVEQVSSYSASEVSQVAGTTIFGTTPAGTGPSECSFLELHVPFEDFMAGKWFHFHQYLSTRVDTSRDKHALSAMLAVYAFTSKSDVVWKATQALAAFITVPELSIKVVHPVSVHEFDLSADTGIYGLAKRIAEGHTLPMERTPAGRLAKLAHEDKYSFSNRKSRTYDSNSFDAVAELASAMQQEWDKHKCRSPQLDRQATYWAYIDFAAFRRDVDGCFEWPWRKYQFGVYIGKIAKIMERLPVASPVNLEHAAPSAICHHQARASYRGYVVIDDLLTHVPPNFGTPPPGFDLPRSTSSSTALVPFASDLPETDSMQKLLQDLRANASDRHESSYIAELQTSADMRRITQKGQESHQSLLELKPALQQHLDDTASHLAACEKALRYVLQAPRLHSRTANLGGHWPRISVLLLLQQLSKDRWPSVPEWWRKCLVQYALAMTVVQRAHRMLAARTWLDLKKELDNAGHANWDPMLHPETLLLEVESGLLVRSVQEDIAQMIRNPPDNLNSVMQLNMGEGKSSVIVPITAVALADRSRLVRVVVAKPQSHQMMHMLISKLGDLLNRRVFYLPFSRDLQPSPQLVSRIQTMLEMCMSEGGMLLLQPEHILSFKLMSIEHAHAGDQDLGLPLLSTQKWLEKHARDIVDESDENFSCKFELIYTIGNQQLVDLGFRRWLIIQRILGLAWEIGLNIHRSDLDGCHVERSQSNTTPVIRIVEDAAGQRLVREIAQRICETGLDGFPIHRQPRPLREKLITYMTEPDVPPDVVEAVESPSNKFFCDATQGALWLLRGLLAGGVILFSLKEKRWRVNYGRTWTRNPATPLAVPYHAKDQPAPRSEFSHPDIIIVLTCLTYYYQGLTDEELDVSFDTLDRKDQVEFDLWVKDSQGFDSNFKQLSSINLKDRKQCLEKVYPTLRYSKAAIDFYLSRVVFAKHMREFPKKLSASGWDLARIVSHPVTGFSGTCDAKYVLPLGIKHLDLPDQLHTNASVLRCLLQLENHVQEIQGGAKSQTFFDTLIDSIVASQGDSIQVILDVGAQVLEYSNVKAAEKWLSVTTDASYEAVIFVNDHDELTVFTRNGMTESLLSSPYSHQTEKCLVFLDEAHTRGIDLKLPETYRAAVTLGPRLSKDRLMQACMRMRKLGVGQSITFFAQPEIQQRIRQLRDYPPSRRLKTSDVLTWSISETWIELRRNILLWATQGIRYQRQEPIWDLCLDSLDSVDRDSGLAEELERYLDDEAQTLEERYRPRPALPQGHLLEVEELHDPDFATRKTELQAIRQKCRDHGIRSFESATLQEEQERELSPELETEKQVERPPRVKAAVHVLSPVVRNFVATGRLPKDNGRDIRSAYAAFEHTTAARLFNVDEFPCDVLVTGDFIRTVEQGSSHVSDVFQRPVRWVVTSHPDIGPPEVVIMSSFEVDELYDELRRSRTVITHQYAPRMNLAFPNLDHLQLYTMPETPRNWSISNAFLVQLNIFAGQSWFKSYAQYVEVCRYLGVSCQANEGAETIAADGFEGQTADNPTCAFEKSPVAFLKAIYNGVRNDSQDVSRTDIGRMLGGELLWSEDFEDR